MRSITLLKVDTKLSSLFMEKKKVLDWTENINNVSKPVLLKSIVHNFLSHNLTKEEHEALSYGLNYHIQTNINRNNIKTEFESSFLNLL